MTRLWMLIAPILALGCIGSIACIGGCTPEAAPSTEMFVGTLRGGEVFAASVWQSDRVLLYTCGTGDSLDTATAWVIGTPAAGTVEGSEHGVSVVATLVQGAVQGEDQRPDQDVVRGVLRVGGMQDNFDLRPISDDRRAGLFALIDGPCRTALIAVADEEGLQFQGAHFCGDAQFSQVTPVLPPETLGAELDVRIEDGSGRVVTLTRLRGI